jgi:hypothetical protein
MTGATDGGQAQPMKPVVANLADEDIVAVALYAASPKP